MGQRNSFERAVFDGDITGPNWPVVDEQGNTVEPGSQDFDKGYEGRAVRRSEGGFAFARVIDYQISAADERVALDHESVPGDG